MWRADHSGWDVLWSRSGRWVVIALALAVSGLALAFGGASRVSTDPAGALPRGSESAAAARLQQDLPSGEVLPALVVYSREGALTGEDRAAIAADAERLAEHAVGGKVPPPAVSPGGDVAMLTVPLPGTLPNAELTETVAEIRAEARAGLPSGARVEVTGGAGFKVDLSAVFAGADITLLAVTASVVALLLLLTYRSPCCGWCRSPSSAVADQVAAKAVALLTPRGRADRRRLDVGHHLACWCSGPAPTTPCCSSRATARSCAYPTIAAGDVRRGAARPRPPSWPARPRSSWRCCTLLFALSPSNRSLGMAGAIGIVVARGLRRSLVLPAALVLFGRGLFWPFAPKAGQADPTRTGSVAARRHGSVAPPGDHDPAEPRHPGRTGAGILGRAERPVADRAVPRAGRRPSPDRRP